MLLALRLYPQIPVNVRVAVRTTTLPRGGGPDGTAPVLIRKGTGVGTSIYHMHRRKDLYGPDAEEFRPERWEGNELDQIGWGFMPFHGGPRICLGRECFASARRFLIWGLLMLTSICSCRGVRAGGGLIRHRARPSGIPRPQTPARRAGRTDRAGKAILDDCRVERGGLQSLA